MEILAETGVSIGLVGILGLQLAAVLAIRNVASGIAGMLWGLSLVVFLFVGLFGLGVEYFWLSAIATTLMLVTSMAAEVMT